MWELAVERDSGAGLLMSLEIFWVTRRSMEAILWV